MISRGEKRWCRAAGPEDEREVVGMVKSVAKETEGMDLDEKGVKRGVQKMLYSSESGFYLVCEVEDPHDSKGGKVIVGMLGVSLEWSDWRGEMFWWLQSVYVLATHRRKGIFTSLFQHLLEYAQTHPFDYKVSSVRLYRAVGNADAERVYSQLGFTPCNYSMMEFTDIAH